MWACTNHKGGYNVYQCQIAGQLISLPFYTVGKDDWRDEFDLSDRLDIAHEVCERLNTEIEQEEKNFHKQLDNIEKMKTITERDLKSGKTILFTDGKTGFITGWVGFPPDCVRIEFPDGDVKDYHPSKLMDKIQSLN